MTGESVYLVDEYVNVAPGEPFRLFPFGRIVKDGKERFVTPELAAKFRLPHFKPPIKLGSHKEETPAGGHIRDIFVGEDGLYAYPEFTDKGGKSVNDGDYRYHSPEVIWEGGLEDPETGEIIEGPLIVGDALLHTPHLGEAAALYSIETKEQGMTEEMVQVPESFWDKLTSVFNAEPTPVEPEVDPEEFTAIQSERDEFKAKYEEMIAEQKLAEKMSAVKSEFETDEFGAAYQELGADEESIKMLSGMTEEQREWVLGKIKGFSAQIDESALTEELGTEGEGLPEDPQEALMSATQAVMDEKKIDFNSALKVVREEQPDLVLAAYGNKEDE